MSFYLLAAAAVLCTLGGYFFPFRIARSARVAILLPLVGVYVWHVFSDTHDLSVLVGLSMVSIGVFVAWRVLPYSFCCGHHTGHENIADHALSALALVPLLLHAVLDVELLRSSGMFVLPLLVLHKFADGTALRVFSEATPGTWLRRVFVAVGILATPLGLLLPEEAAHFLPHGLLGAFVMGFYLYMVFALIRVPTKDAHA